MPKNVAVATSEAGERTALPESPLPDVQPPAVLAPKPISAPATSSTGTITQRASPVNVSVSHP